jgi:MoaA/NifB/PqqE/SkfB family radical SAM enzyme
MASLPLPFTPRAEEGSAITQWRAAVCASEGDAAFLLADIYRDFWPTQGELIFTGACAFQCVHCIYPPSFAKHSRSLGAEQWLGLLGSLAREIGIKTFVYGGRSINAEGITVMRSIRKSFPEAAIGMIDNGISMLPHLRDLHEVRADWLDVSLDGLEEDHDRQRGKRGSFRDGLRGAIYLKEYGFAPRVNILTCLTSLNYRSVCSMIRQVNALGFKNFFITPVTLADGVGPAADLRLSKGQLRLFLEELQEVVSELDDAWVEVLLFSADYAEEIASELPELWCGFKVGRDEIYWDLREPGAQGGAANPLFMRYYPLSLTGIRELIVNTNGDVIVPKAMAYGKVPAEMVLGSLLNEAPGQLVRDVPERPAFEFYRSELRKEASLLRSMV